MLIAWDGQFIYGLGESSRPSSPPGGISYFCLQEPETYGGLISVESLVLIPTVYVYDALGSMVSAWNTIDGYPNASGAYKAFGEVLEPIGPAFTVIGNPFLWNGRSGYYYDVDLGTNSVRARDYQPTTGRWPR